MIEREFKDQSKAGQAQRKAWLRLKSMIERPGSYTQKGDHPGRILIGKTEEADNAEMHRGAFAVAQNLGPETWALVNPDVNISLRTITSDYKMGPKQKLTFEQVLYHETAGHCNESIRSWHREPSPVTGKSDVDFDKDEALFIVEHEPFERRFVKKNMLRSTHEVDGKHFWIDHTIWIENESVDALIEGGRTELKRRYFLYYYLQIPATDRNIGPYNSPQARPFGDARR